MSFELCSNLGGARAINSDLCLLLLQVMGCCVESVDGLMSLGDAQEDHGMSRTCRFRTGQLEAEGFPVSAYSPRILRTPGHHCGVSEVFTGSPAYAGVCSAKQLC